MNSEFSPRNFFANFRIKKLKQQKLLAIKSHKILWHIWLHKKGTAIYYYKNARAQKGNAKESLTVELSIGH